MSTQSASSANRARRFRGLAMVAFGALIEIQACAQLAIAEVNAPRHVDVDEKTIRHLGVDPRIVDVYEVIDFRYTGGIFHDEPFHCGIIKPRPLVPNEKYPLLVWLAGIGPEELDEEAAVGHLRWLEQVIEFGDWSSQKHPCYVLVMKIKAKKGRWFDRYGDPPPANAKNPGDEQVTVLHELIEKVLASHAIDRQRVYLIGVSAGGTACFEMAMRYPKLFAAMVPMATAGGDLARVDRLTEIPVWAFHATSDKNAPVNVIRQTVQALIEAGGIAHLTEIKGSDHNCWTPATRRYDIFAWLFAQRQGHRSYPPGFTPLPWWNWLALGGIVCLVYFVWRSQGRRSAMLANSTNQSKDVSVKVSVREAL